MRHSPPILVLGILLLSGCADGHADDGRSGASTTVDTGVAIVTVLMTVFSLLVVDFFDTLGTMTAVGEEAHLNDEDGIPENSQNILIVDSVAAMAGGAASVSSNTSYIESASGVGDGARTGLASIVTGLAFIVATFLSPLANIVPFEAATPVLVLVGLMMLASATDIDWRDFRIAVPAFLTIIVMPFGYSIAAGIGVGFIAYVVINAATGRSKDVKPLMWVGALAFAVSWEAAEPPPRRAPWRGGTAPYPQQRSRVE